MRRFRRSLRGRSGNQSRDHASRDIATSESKIDLVLRRAAHLSQVALIALSVIGYIYTVRPVFQFERLQEKTAKLELEQREARATLASLEANKSELENTLTDLRSTLEDEKERAGVLSRKAEAAIRREASARKAASEIQRNLTAQRDALNEARWELVWLDFHLSRSFLRINASSERYNNLYRSDEASEKGGFIVEAAQYWPKPFDVLLASIESAEEKGMKRGYIPATYYKKLQAFIAGGKESLVCNLPDLRKIHSNFMLELSSLDSVVESETEEQIQDIRDEYAAKGERVKITKEFRRKTAWSVRFGKEYELEKKYREEVEFQIEQCQEKGDNFVELMKANFPGAS